MSRQNDGLDVGGTSDAYTSRGEDHGRQGQGQGYGHSDRAYDGLDSSNTSDTYSRGQTGGNYRGNDGLDATGTSDAYGSSAGRNTAGAYRDNDGLDARGTSDAATGSGYSRGGDPAYNDRTSGGLGYDDRIGNTARTGGGQRGGDQEHSAGTSGGLGENDTYGDEGDTGGADTGAGQNFGMGSGRTVQQERGGILPTEPGRTDLDRDRDDSYGSRQQDRSDDNYGSRQQGRSDNYDDDGGKKDSTMGKLMEKAGGMLKNDNLRQKGEQKRYDS